MAISMGVAPQKRGMSDTAKGEAQGIASTLIASVREWGLVSVDYAGLAVKETTFLAGVRRLIEADGTLAMETGKDEDGLHLRAVPATEKRARKPRAKKVEDVPTPAVATPADETDDGDDAPILLV